MPATPTFKQNVGAVKSGHQSTLEKYTLPDTDVDGNAVATKGGMRGTMRKGEVFLAQMPDGSLQLCRFDPERWTDANPVILKV